MQSFYSVIVVTLLLFLHGVLCEVSTKLVSTSTPYPDEEPDPDLNELGRPFQTWCYHCPKGCQKPEGKLIKCPQQQNGTVINRTLGNRAVCYIRRDVSQNKTSQPKIIRLCTTVDEIKYDPSRAPINQNISRNATDLRLELKKATDCFDLLHGSPYKRNPLDCKYCDPKRETNGCNDFENSGSQEMKPSALISVLIIAVNLCV